MSCETRLSRVCVRSEHVKGGGGSKDTYPTLGYRQLKRHGFFPSKKRNLRYGTYPIPGTKYCEIPGSQ